MMFMIPMPPTSRLIPAIIATIAVSTPGRRAERLVDLRGVDHVEIVVDAFLQQSPFAQQIDQRMPGWRCWHRRRHT